MNFDKIKTAAAALLVGCISGGFAALFGRVLLFVGAFRDSHIFYLVPFLFVAGGLTVYVYNKWGGQASKGMGLVFDAANGSEDKIPLRLIPLVMVSTWATHLFGGSAGREGVAVQIGAAVGDAAGRAVKADNKDILVTAGMAAGFSGLFGTPFTAIFFVLEVLHAGRLKYKALVPVVIASFSSYIVSGLLGLERFKFDLEAIHISCGVLLKSAAMGVLFGLTGALFAAALKYLKKRMGDIELSPIKRTVIFSVLLSAVLLLLFKGRYCGLGTNLISAALNGDKIYCFDFILKLVLTVFTLSLGFQGGEVTPLFSIGASLGAVLAVIFNVPVPFGAALGYGAVFGAASNTLIAPVLIGCEVFGWQTAPCFIVCCICAYLFSGDISIYKQQRD